MIASSQKRRVAMTGNPAEVRTILLFLPNKVIVDKPVERDSEAENGDDLI